MTFAIEDEHLVARIETQNIVRVTGFIRAERHGLAVRGERKLWRVESAQCHLSFVLLPSRLGAITLDHQSDPFTVLHDFVNGSGQLH